MRTLSLPAKAYLLACDVGSGRVPDRRRVALLVRGAALTDLLVRGRIADEDGRVVPRPGATGDLVLDDLMAEVSAASPRRWKSWLGRGGRATLQAVETQLDAAGEIRLTAPRRPDVRDPSAVAELHERVHAALSGPVAASEVDTDDAVLAALAAAARVRSVVSRGDRRRYRDRLRELESRAGAAAPAVRALARRRDAARMGAIASG